MSLWFRFYSDAMRNPKVAKLTDKEFRLWVELLAVAAENEGSIPPLDDLKYLLKRRLDHLSTGVERLLNLFLIDALEVGYEPHNWTKFQYKSDTSTDRVKKHRAKLNVSVTPPEPETEPEKEEAKASPSSDGAKKPTHFPKPEWAEDQVWSDWMDIRKAKKARNTPTGYSGFLSDIAKLTNAEWPPGRLLEYAVRKSWAGIYEPKEGYPSAGRNGSQTNRPGYHSPGQSTADIGRALAAESEQQAEPRASDRVIDLVPRIGAASGT